MALLHPPVPAKKKQKLNNGVSNTYVSSNNNNYYSYPNLSSALGQEDWFNPMDFTVQKEMWALLAELIDILIDDYELNIIDSANMGCPIFVSPNFQQSIIPELKRMAQCCHQSCWN
jgi:hypothetical protein